MLAVTQETEIFDGRLTGLFTRINNYLLRTKSSIEATDGFLGGVAAFEYKHAYDVEKPFTVSARSMPDSSSLVDVEVIAGQDEKLTLLFDTARNAFCTNCEGMPVSIESARKLQTFMMNIA